jgi:tRNA pseudouridine55 synthase
VTVTDDAEGDVTASVGALGVERDAVVTAAVPLTGAIEQVPSAVSAIKVNGERAYHRVRSGESVELAARSVTVSRFVVGDTRAADADGTPVLDVDVEVTVSSGTYVRALARDLGSALGCGGHLTALRRTRVGGFSIADAHPLADLEARQGERMPVTPLAQAARAAFAVREIDEAQARTLGYGQRLDSAVPGRTEPVAAIGPDGSLVAMLDESRPTARSLVVFAPATS